jgi:YidC/Oxa1 family membrane protein insertase
VDKRFVTFLLLTMLIMVGYLQLRLWLNPPKPQPDAVAQQNNEPDQKQPDQPPKDPDGEDPDGEEPGGQKPPDGEDPPDQPAIGPADPSKARPVAPRKFVTLGSVDPASGYRMMLTFDNRGAALARAELSSPRYHDLERSHGYLGHLALADGAKGAVVNVVGPGTPAAAARCTQGGRQGGLRPGDVIVAVGETTLESNATRSYTMHFEEELRKTRPGRSLVLQVLAAAEEATPAPTLTYSVQLSAPPMSVIEPERMAIGNPSKPSQSPHPKMQPLSFLTTLSQIDGTSVGHARYEISKLPSLQDTNWEIVEGTPEGELAFRFQLSEDELKRIEAQGALEVIKRFRLRKVPVKSDSARGDPGYDVSMTLEVVNAGMEKVEVGLQQFGPTGLPLEGWWYLRKPSPGRGGWLNMGIWSSSGLRDVVWRAEDGPQQLTRNPELVTAAQEQPPRGMAILANPSRPPILRYVGVDTNYFLAALLPDKKSPSFSADQFRYQSAEAFVTSDIDSKRLQVTGVTFRLAGEPQAILPGRKYSQTYTVFIGPKDPQVLAHYGLQDTIEFGWQIFAFPAKVLLNVLHGIYYVIPNYGIAIILLTIFVRLLVYPIGRKQAQNAAKMQELAPEMKAIADKYKDLEQRARAQQELFRRHNYNPLGGCWLLFLQLPIFIGLYKALSVSIDLRQASLIPGIQWCSNLAGPDMFFNWEPYLPAFLAGDTGFLGPYLNVLPLVTIALFIVHQKLFTPPPTDEQQVLQQKMMSYMMIFMGFLFFKVPSGLCLYFITSSLWGIGERKLLPKTSAKSSVPAKPGEAKPSAASKALSMFGLGANGNGASQAKTPPKKKKRRK